MSDKIEKLRELEKLGVVEESCPDPHRWVFRVKAPSKLPKNFYEEYLDHGCIYWYG